MEKEKIICNWCGSFTSIIWIHGHGQCETCGINIDECCRGESCDIEESKESLNEKKD